MYFLCCLCAGVVLCVFVYAYMCVLACECESVCVCLFVYMYVCTYIWEKLEKLLFKMFKCVYLHH